MLRLLLFAERLNAKLFPDRRRAERYDLEQHLDYERRMRTLHERERED